MAVLNGAMLMRCIVCNEVLPFPDDEEYPTKPRWTYVHEPHDGYPNCIREWSNGTPSGGDDPRNKAQELKHQRAQEHGYIRPTREQLARAKKK